MLCLAGSIPFSCCRPEIPTDRYAAPLAEFLPGLETKSFSSAPSSLYSEPHGEYGPPVQTEYGPPVNTEYGAPPAQKLITKNVYVHVPPPEEREYQQPQVIDKPIPKVHYKIIFIKGM